MLTVGNLVEAEISLNQIFPGSLGMLIKCAHLSAGCWPAAVGQPGSKYMNLNACSA